MNRWLITLVAGIAAVTLSGAVMAAQAEAPAPEKAPAKAAGRGNRGQIQRFKNALAKLTLTDDQKKKVDEAVTATQAEMKKIREGEGTPQEKRPKNQAAIKAFREKLNTILTPEQQKQLREEMKPKADPAAPKAEPADVTKGTRSE